MYILCNFRVHILSFVTTLGVGEKNRWDGDLSEVVRRADVVKGRKWRTE